MIKILLSVAAILFILCDENQALVHLELEGTNSVFDPALYQNVLNSEECTRQLEHITQNENLALRLRFLESGLRVPRGIQLGNLMDWGNYHQCLGINEEVDDMKIEGKYYILNVPAGQFNDIELENGMDFNLNNLVLNNETVNDLRMAKAVEAAVFTLTQSARLERVAIESIQNFNFTLALCVPKPCTSEDGISGLLFNVTAVGFQYEENFSRMTDDKPWAPIDYITIAIFFMILLLSVLSTSYDLYQKHFPSSDSKNVNKIYQSFSVYTNARRLVTFTHNPDALPCLDGIRSISMFWIILGHTFSTMPARVNVLDAVDYILSLKSLWITSAPISVDTFFMLSGLLLVYTTAKKMTSKTLMKNIHLFYLNRLLRMFPLLAAAILIQASILFRISDGPMWNTVAQMTNDCRIYWWSTLLYVQNFVNTTYMCVPHSWYLAIDMQLHIISPLILIWVLIGNKKIAWIALSSSLLIVLAGSTIYNFLMEFPSSALQPTRADESLFYSQYYYVFTLPRASPFFVGMMFGYLLHICRGEKIKLSALWVFILWISSFVMTSLAIYSSQAVKSMDWDNQVLDSLINSAVRPAWALGIGWLIFACTHGYAGPINWFLSLSVWKLPSRLSYGMYLFHYCTMMVTAGTALSPIYFTTLSSVYRFFSELSIAMLLSFTMTLLFDSPFSTLIKVALGGGSNKNL